MVHFNILKQITSIFAHFIKALVDFKSGALKYLVYTGLIALAVFSVLIYVVWQFSGLGGEWLASIIPWEWAKQSIVFSVIIGISIAILLWIVMKYIMLMLMSPILSIVSEKAEKDITGRLSNSSFSIASSTARSVRINLRNIVKEIVVTVLLLMASLIPGLNIFAVVSMFFVQAYFAGFGIMDFYLERHLTFSQTVKEVYSHKWAAMAIGSIFTFLFLIPIIGVIIAPYFTTIAATKYFGEIYQKNNIILNQ